MDTSSPPSGTNTHPNPPGSQLPINISMTPLVGTSPDEASSLLFANTQSTPTPKGKKLAGPPTMLHPTSDDEMDDDQPNNQLHPTERSHPSNQIPRRLITSHSEDNISITHAPRLTTKRPISLEDRAITAKEKPAINSQQTRRATRSPLDKFTNGNMPKVHVANPMSTLEFVDIPQLVEWEHYPKGKLLAIPFGIEAADINNHDDISNRILSAAGEITQSTNISISTPTPSEEALLQGNTPTSFLLYNLLDTEISTLMQRGVWSSIPITFRVAELYPPQPDFLFTLKGFKTRDETTILNSVKTVWQSTEAQNLIEDVAETFDEDSRHEIRNNIQAFLNSSYIKCLKFKQKGNIEVPRFNIYADSQLIHDDNIWSFLRESLAALTYKTPMQSCATTEISPSHCSICHGVDHPTGMCEFPQLEGWNGPTRDDTTNRPQNGGKRFRNIRSTR